MLRKAAVRGYFYPFRAEEIEAFIAENARQAPRQKEAKGLILPHAGYIYSAKTAIRAIEEVRPKQTLLMLGPSHTGRGEPFSLSKAEEWESVFRNIKVDSAASARIIEKCKMVKQDEDAHLKEHSLEVELPLLDYFFYLKANVPFKIVPLVCQAAAKEELEKLAFCLAEALKDNKDDFLVIASSDMTHYEPEEQARKKDKAALERIRGLDEEGLWDDARRHNFSICGLFPIIIALKMLKALHGRLQAEISHYTTSAETNGDITSVVGYSSVIIY